MPLTSFIKRIGGHIAQGGMRSAWTYLKHTCSEKYHEALFGIDTRGYLNAEEIGLINCSADYNEYEPITFSSIITALNEIDIDPERDIFLDYGCGKGRAVVVAATRPFKKVIGVELSDSLAGIAQDNAGKARFLRCRDIEIITADATKYQLPDNVTVVLLYTPFVGEALKQVITNINESWSRSPRPITILHKYPHWTNDPFEEQSSYQLKKEIVLYSEAGEKLRIYRHN